MADIVMQKILDILLETAGIGDRAGGRVFDRTPLSPIDPPFPIITLHRVDPGYSDPMTPLQEFDLLISVFSDISTDQAKSIQEAIRAALHARAFQSGGASFVTWERHPPITTIDATSRVVYIAHVSYRINLIGP